MVETEMAQNHPDQAMQLLQTESAKAPNRMDLLLALGNTAVRAGKFDLAISYFEKVAASLQKGSKAQGDIYLRIGETYRRKGDLTNSIVALQKAREILPENGVVLSTLALVLDAAGRWSEARQVYEVVIKLDPNNGVALNNLAFLLTEHGGDLDDALTKAQRAKQLLPDLSEVSDTLGWIYLKKNLTDNAIDIFKDLVTKVPAQAVFRYHLGMAYSQKGDKTRALKELQDALKYNPTKADRDKIQQLITRLGSRLAPRRTAGAATPASRLRSFSRSSGFVRYPFMPACRQMSRYSAVACAVSPKMTGWRSGGSRLRISRVAARPSTSGICTSIRIRS